MVFDKKFFTINGNDGTDLNPVLITDKATGPKRDTRQLIKIKCIDEFRGRQEILGYGYPKDSLTKTTAEQLILRKVVGKIVLESNKNTQKVGKKAALKNRKDLNAILVGVKVDVQNIPGNLATGVFDIGLAANETTIFQNALYQSLVETILVKQLPDSTGTVQNIVLDLSNDLQFQLKKDTHGNPIDSSFIDVAGNIKPPSSLLTTLKAKFNTQTANKYRNDFLIFAFNETCPNPLDPNYVINGFAEATHFGTKTIFKKAQYYLIQEEMQLYLTNVCMG